MQMTIKRSLLLILLVVALLAVLVSGVIRSSSVHGSQLHQPSGHNNISKQIAAFCPAPPIVC